MPPFTPPSPEQFGGFSVAGLTDLATVAAAEHSALVASVTEDSVTTEQLDRLEELQTFIAAANDELERRDSARARFAAAAAAPVVAAATEPATEEPATETPAEPVVASTTTTNDAVVDVSSTVQAGDGVVVEATVTAASAAGEAPRRSVQIADTAPHSTVVEVQSGDAAYTILAAGTSAGTMGAELTWESLGRAFEEGARSHNGLSKLGGRIRNQTPLAQIRREYPDGQIVKEGDSHEIAFAKLKSTADSSGRPGALVAANGWCAPSMPDYSICNPTTTDGLLSLPEMVLRRGGLLHNQGLDFGDFFGNDFVLPIPGFNIMTEAQVIADTAKTCVEIPCPEFVDDRLDIAALCLTGSLLQNRGYPEFVSEFVQGSIAAMAHLVNREVVNAIEAGSVATNLSAVDPWGTDGTVWSQLMAVIDFTAMDLRYIYRASRTQTVDFVFPYWVRQALRSDWLRRNATHTEELTDQMIDAALARRNARVQWIYDWQDAFDPANGAGAIAATNQMGNATPPLNNPTAVTFLAYLPGTWILGRQDVIRLDLVYDSTNLQQNLVTQLFMEDGFRPMRMCQHSRAYTVTLCASGSTGVQRAVACADVTP